ncbi:MAG TPA: MerR family transcriptional regulator [Bryobacteraceae bacterium]|nr:MerR family transcriptional regulator [Bryobacteraceae bacterium]
MNPSGAEVEPLAGIPEKLYFRIGEVSRLIGVPPYVLRYWETEFPALAPKKSGAGHRFYRRKDVELLLEIKQLLYEKRYTIEGARKYMETKVRPARRERQAKAAPAPAPASQQALFGDAPSQWQSIRSELASILDLLK